MTVESNKLLQQDPPIIRDGKSQQDTDQDAPNVVSPTATAALPVEIGGRDGPEPTRFGDWEKGGRCIDF